MVLVPAWGRKVRVGVKVQGLAWGRRVRVVEKAKAPAWGHRVRGAVLARGWGLRGHVRSDQKPVRRKAHRWMANAVPSSARRQAPGVVQAPAWVRKVRVVEKAPARVWDPKGRVVVPEVLSSAPRAVRQTHVAAAPNSGRREAPAVHEPIAAPATHGMTKREQIQA